MPDPIDIAQKNMEQLDEIRERQRAAIASRPRPVSEDCIDCGVDIPQARQEATGGTERCTHCQGYFDTRKGRG